jgi:uncharacterized protein (DUF1778 family)
VEGSAEGCVSAGGLRLRFRVAWAARTRTAQVNVRLTAEEKALLESTAKRKCYSGLSDFIRAAAIELAR